MRTHRAEDKVTSKIRGANSRGRTLPVVRWLQIGAAAAGVGMALVAAPAIASADDGGASEGATQLGHRPSQGGAESAVRAGSVQHASALRRGSDTRGAAIASPASAVARKSTATVSRQLAVPVAAVAKPVGSAPDGSTSPAAASAAAALTRPAPVAARSVTSDAASRPSVAAEQRASIIITGQQVDPIGQFAAFFGLPGAPATAAPSFGAFPTLMRLTLEDIVTGTGPAFVADPTAVVTGLFNQVLRVDPTSEDLQNYLGIFNLTGVNGVIAGLYSSTQFRQAEVNNYYLELLGRPATQAELTWGATQLIWGTPEPLFAASIAGSQEFYQGSSAGGGSAGAQPSATTYVSALYRTLLGQTADPEMLPFYVDQIQNGLPLGLAAIQFVTSDAFRQVKVGEIYSVLGQTATTQDISSAVGSWFRNGGLAGIATGLLATSSNVQRIEAGQVTLPDMTAAAQLQQLLLAAYTSTPDGFVKLFNQLLNVDANNPCTPSSTTCNQALFSLLTSGGWDRGLPNSAIALTYGSTNVTTMVPTQNEIDFLKSLKFPLQDPTTLQTYFAGGVIAPFSGPVISADNGTYIVDGHHRWSAIFLINPNAQVQTIDMGYVPTPQTALKQAQIAIAAQLGYLKVSEGGGINLYDCTQATFNQAVVDTINAGNQKAAVLTVFGNNLAPGQNLSETDLIPIIQRYLWDNVLRMRTNNPFVPNATDRNVMPQLEPPVPILGYLSGGSLSYSFPIISYLG